MQAIHARTELVLDGQQFHHDQTSDGFPHFLGECSDFRLAAYPSSFILNLSSVRRRVYLFKATATAGVYQSVNGALFVTLLND